MTDEIHQRTLIDIQRTMARFQKMMLAGVENTQEEHERIVEMGKDVIRVFNTMNTSERDGLYICAQIIISHCMSWLAYYAKPNVVN